MIATSSVTYAPSVGLCPESLERDKSAVTLSGTLHIGLGTTPTFEVPELRVNYFLRVSLRYALAIHSMLRLRTSVREGGSLTCCHLQAFWGAQRTKRRKYEPFYNPDHDHQHFVGGLQPPRGVFLSIAFRFDVNDRDRNSIGRHHGVHILNY